MSNEKKGLSKKQHYELFQKVDNEGFGYYMLHYGPDLKAIAKLGFNKKEVEAACKLFSAIEDRIFEGEDMWEPENE